MAITRQSRAQYFAKLKSFMQRHEDCHFQTYHGFPEPSAEGHPIDIDDATFALTHTAEVCLGPGHSIRLHGFEDPSKVGALLLLITGECKSELQDTEHATEDLGALVYGVFVTAYTYADDHRSLERILRNHDAVVLWQNRLQAA